MLISYLKKIDTESIAYQKQKFKTPVKSFWRKYHLVQVIENRQTIWPFPSMLKPIIFSLISHQKKAS